MCVVCVFQRGSMEEPVSLLVHQKMEEFEDSERRQTKAGIVTWSPPQQNWNPWVGCNIDEGPMAHVRLHFWLFTIAHIEKHTS